MRFDVLFLTGSLSAAALLSAACSSGPELGPTPIQSSNSQTASSGSSGKGSSGSSGKSSSGASGTSGSTSGSSGASSGGSSSGGASSSGASGTSGSTSGSSGTAAAACGQKANQEQCYTCCEQANPKGIEFYFQKLDECACAANACATQCAQSYCKQGGPDPKDGDACATCLDGVADRCYQQADQKCADSADCVALLKCDADSKCETKPQ